jgi:hypothetical protein
MPEGDNPSFCNEFTKFTFFLTVQFIFVYIELRTFKKIFYCTKLESGEIHPQNAQNKTAPYIATFFLHYGICGVMVRY